MKQTPAYDVAIIGAGPSGSRTAEALAASGHRVVLLERDPEPGLPVHCTGIVSTECFDRYHLPSSLILRSVSSFVLRSPSGRGAPVKRNATQAHVLDRIALDRLLAQRAVDAGAELITSATVTAIDWDGQSVRVHGKIASREKVLDARAAVLATGHGSRLQRHVGLSTRGEVVSGCQAVVEAPDVDEVEVFTGSVMGFGGYGWLVPWKPGLALTGLLTRRDTMAHLQAHIAKLQEAGRIGAVRELFRLRALPLGVPERSVVDGVLGVGDAVSQVKPTSGGGIYYGLLGAEAAAQTLTEALAADDVSAAGLAAYDERWQALLGPEIRQGYALRRLLEQIPEPVVEQFHRLLSVPGLRRILTASTFDWHSGPLTSVLNRMTGRSSSRQLQTR